MYEFAFIPNAFRILGKRRLKAETGIRIFQSGPRGRHEVRREQRRSFNTRVRCLGGEECEDLEKDQVVESPATTWLRRFAGRGLGRLSVWI
jgi:hypothetical protein